MSTKITSSPSDMPSSSTSKEIMAVEDPNYTPSSTSSVHNASTHNVSNEENEKPDPKAKKQSTTMTCLRHPFKSRRKISEPTATTSAAAAANKNSGPSPNDNNRSHKEVEVLLKLIEADLNCMRKARDVPSESEYADKLKKASKNFDKVKEKGGTGTADEYRELKETVKELKQELYLSRMKKLKQEMSSKHKDESKDSKAHGSPRSVGTVNVDKVPDKMPDLDKNAAFEQSSEFKDFVARYNELQDELKLCLLCFSVFPENVEIKKRVMIYWWIGEGFVPPIRRENTEVQKTADQFGNEFFNELIAKGFIEPVYKKRSVGVDTCKMHPFVRCIVIKLAKRANFFDFDDEGNAIEDYSHSLRSCLTGKGLTKIQSLETLHALFNVNEAILEFKPEWFSRMQNVNVLYLGRWQTSAMHHIEVEDISSIKTKNVNVLDWLGNMKHLRFLSLQGISRITELPESISKLMNLLILDIRACHNLEVIPDRIGLLKNLTHLDMSECYLLDQMPKGLASLFELQVLHGFVVGASEGKNFCTLDDLRKLPKLRKLSIHTGMDEFPSERDLRALSQFKELSKLAIAWGRGSEQPKRDDASKQDTKKDISAPEQATAAGKKEMSAPEQATAAAKKDISAPEQATAAAMKEISAPEQATAASKKEISAPEQATAAAKKDISAPEQATAAAKKSHLERAPTKSFIPMPADSADISAPEQATAAAKKSHLERAPTKSFIPKPADSAALPKQLIKLDLQCFPRMTTPDWLRPCKLTSLKKLYIRGGKFYDLGQFEEFDGKGEVTPQKDMWKVEELRLKYLTELKMDWRELQELFPNLNYLDKVQCPKLTCFPCNENGVWIKKK